MSLFSIITVSFNEAENIVRTIESVISQSYKDYEYIIVDGGSKDGTYEIEEKMLSEINNINAKISSEPDTGIYNAMNKGIYRAEGDWLLFLNAGDSFVNRRVLENIAIKISKAKECSDIYYGEVICKYKNLYKVIKTSEPSMLKFRMPFCHQCAVIKKELMKKYKYDESYRIAADYNFFLSAYLDNARFESIHNPIAVFSLDGISSRESIESEIEYLSIRYSKGVLSDEEYAMVLHKLEKIGKRKETVKKMIPETLRELYRRFKLKKAGYSLNKPTILEE